MDDWATLEARIQENLANVPNVVLLDVGGTIFKMTKNTLLQVEGSYFHALLGSGLWQPDSHDKAYFLDLDPVIFRHVMQFLRTGQLSIEGLTKGGCDELKAMTAYLDLNVGDKWNQWNPHALPPRISLFNEFRTIECTGGEWGEWVAFALHPLGSIQIRVDKAGYTSFGAGPTTGPDAWNIHYSTTFFQRDLAGTSTHPTVVAIRRHPSHIEVALNDSSPTKIEVNDATEQLFPAVASCDRGRFTILSS